MQNKKSEKADLENKKGIFFIIGLTTTLSAVLFAFEWKTQPREILDLGSVDYVPEDVNYIPPTINHKKKVLPKPVTVSFFELVNNDADIEEIPDLFDTEFDKDILFKFKELVTPHENKVDKEEDIFVVVEEMPQFPGGDLALQKYIANALKYPAVAVENGMQGKVYVSFIIDEEGNISDVLIVRGVDASLDNEALRVIRSLPRWKPGKQGGKAVKVKYFVPINFELQ